MSELPDPGMRCLCMISDCGLCNQDMYNYFQTAQYLVHTYESKKGWLDYRSPYTKRKNEYGVADDLGLLIKRGKQSKPLVKLLIIVV